MNCPYEERSALFVIGELTPVERLAHARHAQDCEVCREAIADTAIGDALLQEHLPGLFSAEPPTEQAPATRPSPAQTHQVRWSVGLSLAVAAMALLALWRQPSNEDYSGIRSIDGAQDVPELVLSLAVQSGEDIDRLHRDRTYKSGDRAMFQISAEPHASVFLWVMHEDGMTVLAQTQATSQRETVQKQGQPLEYTFRRSGTHFFFLSSTGLLDCLPQEGCLVEEVVIQ